MRRRPKQLSGGRFGAGPHLRGVSNKLFLMTANLNTYSTLLTALSDGILTVTINRPDKLNALNAAVFTDLASLADEVESNAEVKAVILTGAGEKAFVAGADIAEFSAFSRQEAEALSLRGQKVFARLESSAKPVVAAVNGFALGGGCELAMACHFRTASESARFGQPEVNLGLIPGYGGTQRLTQLVGKGKSMELNLTGDMLSAEEAKAWGLVNHVFPAADLLAETRKLVSKMTAKAPLALARAIACVNDAAAADTTGFEKEAARFGELFETEDMREGTGAFLEKRKPAFQGK